ncbi:unnamed protein product [Rhizoctonia solani]|uniref:Uncharacterized protein n=1 Tax=Rhizoctonia solani TaxID=456999 RepID=A0A8H3AWP2_9AGAM|nr:unnamed protein product [Rhizoctonia solani]
MKASIISILALGASFAVALPLRELPQTHSLAVRDKTPNAGAEIRPRQFGLGGAIVGTVGNTASIPITMAISVLK